MKRVKVLSFILPLWALLLVPAFSSAEQIDFVPYQSFISETLDDLMFLFEDSELTDSQRVDKLSAIWDERFATSYISRFILGQYARKADKAAIERFQNVFGKVTALSLSERAREIGKPTYTFKRSKNLKNSVMITTSFSEVLNGNTIDIDWRILNRNERYLIVDIVIADISMLQSFRSEYTAYLRGNKGDVEALIKELEQKLATVK